MYHNNYQEEDPTSASDKFINNSGRQPGLGKRKFVPPTKNEGSGCGSFNPGKSVQQHILNGSNKDNK